ncbi:MAG: DUF6515 family protein [Limisphaerales bacterium]
MKATCLTRDCVLGVVVAFACLVDSPRVLAAWGSIRANNRSEPQVRRGEEARGPVREGEAHGRGVPSRPEIRQEPRREVGRREDIEHEQRELRRMDIDRDRDGAYFWSHYRPGIVISTLPPGSVPLSVGVTPYYYDQGVFYENSPSGYVVVPPPVGAVVTSLPPGPEALAAGSQVYYYAGGSFYVQRPEGGFVVEPTPVGVIVNTLPAGAVPVTINGVLYYEADGAYFLPVMENGVTAYETAQP